MFLRAPFGLSSLAAIGLLACGHAAPAPGEPGATAFYRQRLAEGVKGERAIEYRDALESSEFADAKRKGTILSFRTFLSEFPAGPHQREARTLLESLRWNEASADGSEAALQGFLADEPRGAHSGDAWARIAALQLEAAEQSGSGELLRAWLAAHPDSPERSRARLTLAEIEFREASGAPIARRRSLLRAFLAAHPESPRHAEAEELEARAAVDEAVVLEDVGELRAWARSGRADAAKRLASLELAQAAARLDMEALTDALNALGRTGRGPDASKASPADPELARRASQLSLELKRQGPRAKPLIEAARALYLPAPPDNSPEAQGPREHARALFADALRLDGRALPSLLSAMGSQQGWAAVIALHSALLLFDGLPPPERALRGARAAAALEPLAQDGPRLSALALARLAAGDATGALAAARTAAARDPRSLVVQALAGMLETSPLGDRSLAPGAVHAEIAAVRAALAMRPQSRGREPEPNTRAEGEASPTLWSLCAASRVAGLAQAQAAETNRLASPAQPGGPDETARREVKEQADAVVSAAAHAVKSAERAARKEGACEAELQLIRRDEMARIKLREGAAAVLLKAGDLAAEALARARERDGAPEIRQALGAGPGWPGVLQGPPDAPRAATIIK